MGDKPTGGPHEDTDNDPPGQTTTTTTTSGTTGGTSGGGSSSGPSDPYSTWYTGLSPVETKYVSRFDSIYYELWGEPAPLAVLQSAVAAGLNSEEFRIAQMKNDAWWDTPAAADLAEERDNYLEALGFGPIFKRKKGKKGGKGGDNKGPRPGNHSQPGQVPPTSPGGRPNVRDDDRPNHPGGRPIPPGGPPEQTPPTR